MKTVNAKLKSQEEMALYLVKGGELYDEGVKYYYNHFLTVKGKNGFVVEVDSHSFPDHLLNWSRFAELRREMTISEAVLKGDKVPCWTSEEKKDVCLIVEVDNEFSPIDSNGVHCDSAIAIEPDDLL